MKSSDNVFQIAPKTRSVAAKEIKLWWSLGLHQLTGETGSCDTLLSYSFTAVVE
jgi:hypothetical protein